MKTNSKGIYTFQNGMKLDLNFNALAEYESMVEGSNGLEVMARMASGQLNVTEWRTLLYCGLKVNQPEVTLEEAGEMLAIYFEDLVASINKDIDEAAAEAGKPKAGRKKAK
ncbi:hypothetical protein GQF56_07270 [Rhodobacter sphaeroides]|jgi:hypothetical protein|uniref:Uncharacterized protein n=1 Tax=Cereibacter sphaeroides (strain ATCC 17023 / DSM 158 / JCM 6121 / CCUG 31486 / LMG 2827 / NBRC 12203 / NCIMB 8253 / ATH 2.4.1.) TaxID=272943 RepID=U5NRH0_CERS4|nr:hypothetical protein [Cereibacter sphaeroides]AGY32415.1 hypothetical protein RSP_7539 [Cereibacter sphaeroides 2.4.1]AXC61365.1 hypothetical protein DQL45_08315 [Cereibacter sphaeroides 2.4.1]MVX47672.1 hypothetical protein [Cereibacter sphaeroides]QHA10961.1 hypothetical protein GQR99_08310 [Cereibacter sphaeroides]QHA13448.1 hypothetical protein GQY06_08295 [Cereibacter sphaeroides]